MSQNLVANHLGPDQWATVDEAITNLETALAPMMVALSRTQQRRLVKMGDGSVAFCRQALDVMENNTGLLPRDFDVAEVRRDLETHDALNARLVRLGRLLERADDAEMALGSDVMTASLEGYAFLKIAGEGEGVEALKQMLGRRFDTSGSGTTTTQAPIPAPEVEPAI